MAERYGLVGPVTRDLLTYQGRVIVHDSRQEMEFLLPESRIVRINGDVGPEIALRDHPSMASVRWPVDPADFI